MLNKNSGTPGRLSPGVPLFCCIEAGFSLV